MVSNSRINFSLPPFQRITWASEELKNSWESVVRELPQFIEEVFHLRDVVDLFPIRIKTLPTHQVYEYKKAVESKGLFAEHIMSLPEAIQFAFGVSDTTAVPVVTGARKSVQAFLLNIADCSEVEKIAALPAGTLAFWQNYSAHQWKDSQWAYLKISDDSLTGTTTYQEPSMNTILAKLGILPLPYYASSPECGQSIENVKELHRIAQPHVNKNMFSMWRDLLSWPCEWSALHGIAEVKTPLFKMIYNTDATGTKHTLRFESKTYPENGLKGRLFPYRSPSALLFSESKKFQRADEHLKKLIN